MSAATPLLLYSTNTRLAYELARRYYDDVHYIWCSSIFNSRGLPPGVPPFPPSSAPGDVFISLRADIDGGDRHSARIKQNKEGLRRGADFKESVGEIDAGEKADIYAIIDQAELRDFQPLLYVIPFSLVAGIVKPVPVKERASIHHEEFIIENLPRSVFDIVEF